jgi:DNA-binding GntR family transcriptional regulator
MSVTPSIQQRIREDIVSGQLPFGARVTIDELATRYGVSHMPIREALRELHGEGLVMMEPNRGARIRSIDREFVANLFEMRGTIEALLTSRAAERCSGDDLLQLQAIQSELERHVTSGDHASALACNREFHRTINLIADNLDAIALVDRHWLLIAALWRRYGYGPERFAGVINDHRHLLRALEAGDSKAAGVIMAAHVIKAKQELLDRMAQSPPPGEGPSSDPRPTRARRAKV